MARGGGDNNTNNVGGIRKSRTNRTWAPGDRPVKRGPLRKPSKRQPVQLRVGIYNPDTFRKGGTVNNLDQHLSKPYGGVWTADYNEHYGSEWLNIIPPEKGADSFLLKAKKDAHVLVLSDHEDYKWFLENHRIEMPLSEDQLEFIEMFPDALMANNRYGIDWETLSSQYDGLRVENTYIFGQMTGAMYDIDSTVWFNSDCFEAPEIISADKWLDDHKYDDDEIELAGGEVSIAEMLAQAGLLEQEPSGYASETPDGVYDASQDT